MKQLGFLFDVSGSMKSSYEKLQNSINSSNNQNNEPQTRYNTVINILEKLVEEEELKDIDLYSFAFGTQNDQQICDLVDLIQQYQNLQDLQQQIQEEYLQQKKKIEEENRREKEKVDEQQQKDKDLQNSIDSHQEVYQWAERNGAPNLSSYFTLQDFKENISKQNSFILYKIMLKRVELFKKFIDTLPYQVKISKDAQEQDFSTTKIISDVFNFATMKPTIDKPNFEDTLLERLQIDEKNIKTTKVKDLKDYFQNYENLQNISKNVLEKVAYGGTPLCKTLKITSNFIISQQDYLRKKNILFIISDGQSTDGSISQYSEILKQSKVIVCTCFITDQTILKPKQLYSNVQSNWDKATREMFEISTELDNSELTFLARNAHFQLSTKGKSRLFIQANDPQILNEFIKFITEVRNETDTLLDIIGKFDIESYVNSSNQFEPKSQDGGTCYANAVAASYCMSTRRIYERSGGYLKFEEVRNKLISQYGPNGAVTKNVLRDTCKEFRLRYQAVDIDEAKQALNAGRPLVAIFKLSKSQWTKFSQFYGSKPSGILETVGNNDMIELGGHAVILIGYTDSYLRFLNSWGTNFADGGFFKVKDEQVLGEMSFYDVYWTVQDLLPEEIQKYQENSARIISQRAQRYKDIYENVSFTCPECKEASQLSKYSGTIYLAKCPRCLKEFKPQKLGDTFISYIYGNKI